jgi:hypothetical protein
MPMFSTPPPCTVTLGAPLTKLSRDKIYPYCACPNKIPLRYVKIAHTMCAIIVRAHNMRQYYACITQYAPCNAIFSTYNRTPIFFCATPNFSVCTRTPIFFRSVPNFSAYTSMPIFCRATPNFSVCTRMPIFFHAAPNFSACTRMIIFFHNHKLFIVHHAFLVFPPLHIHFYAHQFLVNSAA